MKPIRWADIRRNEVDAIASPRSKGIFIEDSRQQRAGLILRNVCYRLWGEFDFIPSDKREKTHNPVPEWLVNSPEADAMQPVSYTHLDVYKRQGQGGALLQHAIRSRRPPALLQ